MVQQVLNGISYELDGRDDLFRIHNLQYMFKELRNHVAGEKVWASETFSAREIDKDINAYAPGICCQVKLISRQR